MTIERSKRNLPSKALSSLLSVALVCAFTPFSSAFAAEAPEDGGQAALQGEEGSSGGDGSNEGAAGGGSYAEGKIIVVFDEGVQANARSSSLGTLEASGTRTISEDLGSDEAGAAVAIDLPEDVSVEDAVAQAQDLPGVYLAQPCYTYELVDQDEFADVDEGQLLSASEASELEASSEADGMQASTVASPLTTTVNDPYANISEDNSSSYNQWWLYSANSFDSWDIAKVSNQVAVCILDTGINFEHPDLAANILTDYAYDSYAGEPLTKSPSSSLFAHGSHVAGIVAGVANNGVGIAGASYNANILPINCFYETYDWYSGSQAYTDDEYLINAYEYLFSDSDGNGRTVAEETNTRVVNMSLGGYGSADAALETIINKAKGAGILSVCAGGNGDDYGNPLTDPSIPGDYDACISVVATDSTNTRASWADYNQYKDISAPGMYIWSTWYTGDSYYCASGTSMASPLVAGIAAQLFALNPNLTVDEVKDALYNTATDLGDAGWDQYYGWGLVNASAAASYVGRVRVTAASETVYHTQSVQMSAAPIQSDTTVDGWTWSVVPVTGEATIDQNGLLTATKAGTVRVTASATVGGETIDGSTTVTIKEIELSAGLAATTDRYGSVELTWGAAAPAELVAGYRVYRAELSSDDYELLATADASAVGYSDTAATPGKPYHYKVVPVAKMDGQDVECGMSEAAMGVLFSQVSTLSSQSEAIDYLLMRAMLSEEQIGSVVIVGEDASTAEGLVAASLAGALGAPVVTVGADELSENAEQSLAGSGAEKGYIVGGTDKVSDTVGAAVQEALGSAEAPTRFTASTTAALAETVYNSNAGYWGDTVVIVADSDATSDGALAAAAYVWSAGAPVLSTNSSGKLSATTRNKVRTGGFSNALIIGSEAAVSADVEAQLADCGVPASGITRLAEQSATVLSSDIASYGIETGAFDADGLYAGEPNLAAALAAAAPAGTDRMPLVFVQGDDEDGFTALLEDLPASDLQSITFVDGSSAVASAEKERIARMVELVEPALTDLSAASVTGAQDVVYTGEAWEPLLTVTLDGTDLVLGRDYRVSYANNVEVGTATAKVRGIGEYRGAIDVTFSITSADRTALVDAIEAATADRDDTPVSADGSDVAPGAQYVTSQTYPNTLTSAIGKAQKVADDPAATSEDIAAAIEALNGVKEKFDAAKKTAGAVDKTALAAAIAAGRADLSATAVSDDGSDLEHGTQYVTESAAKTFESALAQAQGVVDNASASAAQVSQALSALADAQAAFTASKQTASAPAPTGIALDRSSVVLAMLRSTALTATVSPAGAAEGAITWTSSAPGVAQVSSEGVVTGVASGTATVTARTEGGLAASCRVVVVANTSWTRLEGGNRYDTMGAIVSEGFSEIGGTVIVATGENFPDALAASSLAGALDAPVVLTSSSELSSAARSQLSRLKPSQVIIMGDNTVVSDAVAGAVSSLSFSPAVTRIAGADRQETSVKAYEALAATQAGASDTCIIATGFGYADALSISPYSYATSSPVFLTAGNGMLTDQQVAAIQSGGFANVVIVGDEKAVPDEVKGQLGSDFSYLRLGGKNRYETSALIAQWEIEMGMQANNMALATGGNFPDALAGGALCGKSNAVLVLVSDDNTSALDAVVGANASGISEGYVLGSNEAVSDEMLAKAEQLTA